MEFQVGSNIIDGTIPDVLPDSLQSLGKPQVAPRFWCLQHCDSHGFCLATTLKEFLNVGDNLLSKCINCSGETSMYSTSSPLLT